MDFRAIDQMIEEAIANGAFPSACVAIGRGDKVYHTVCRGVTRLENGIPVNEDTLYDMASLSKVMGPTMVLLRAIETGKITLDDTLCDYFENVPEDKKNITVLVILFIVGVVAVFGYSVWNYNTSSLSADYTAQERTEKNMSMVEYAVADNASLEGQTVVTVIESAYPKFRDPNVTYNVAVYIVDEAEFEANIAEKKAADANSTYGMDTLNGYSKSKAKADDALVHQGYATIVINAKTGELVSYSDDIE